MVEAICIQCGAEKDLALGRCGACGRLPSGPDRELALLASARVLGQDELVAVQERIRRGARLNPSAESRRKARAILAGAPDVAVSLTTSQIALLVLANIALTPLLGWAVWMRLRRRPGPGARQAFVATVSASAALAGAWLARLAAG